MGWMNRRPAGRAGLTLVEVLIALAVFLVGSVSIIGLFVTASALHKDAVQRRTASYIAEGLLAEIKGMPFREVFAKSNLNLGGGTLTDADTTVDVVATEADSQYQAAAFNLWPLSIAPELGREAGPILIDSEWMWYESINADSLDLITQANRGLWGTDAAEHDDGARVLQPRTWVYMMDEQPSGADGELPSLEDVLAAAPPDVTQLYVLGNPRTVPDADGDGLSDWPREGYIVVDEEWIHYTDIVEDGGDEYFEWDDSAEDRGAGDTAAPEHIAGTPVTVAREHSHYPGYYYAVQFYPVNARGAHSKVTVSVGYGTRRKLRRAHFFHTVYTPSRF